MTREVIRETMGGEEQVAFIDYSRGSEEGHLRFQSPEAAEKAMDALGECKEKDFGAPHSLTCLGNH